MKKVIKAPREGEEKKENRERAGQEVGSFWAHSWPSTSPYGPHKSVLNSGRHKGDVCWARR